MSYRKTLFLINFIIFSLLLCPAQSFAQEALYGVIEYNGLDLSVAKAEIVDRDPANSYILIVLRIKNNSDKTVRYAAKNERELLLNDDRGKRYYGTYAQDFPESGFEILPGEQQRIAYAFQNPDLDCSMFTMSFSKYDLQGLEQVKGQYRDDGSIKIPIPVKNVLVWPKAKEWLESDFKKELNINGLMFIVNEVFIWGQPAGKDTASSPPRATPASLGITFDFINALMTTRIDIKKDFSYTLVDDLGNIYESVRPKGYSRKLKVTPDRFPSVYPGEAYQETVFFEPPAVAIEYLIFTINAKSVGIKKEIRIKILSNEIQTLPLAGQE